MANNSSEQRNLIHNVVVFGEIGVGKGSVINMIAGNPVATTSADGLPCTFKSIPYDATLNNKRIRLWDTAGMPEGEITDAVARKAIINLYLLLRGLEDGISLLVLCMRAKMIRSRDYHVFYEGLCQRKVPIVLVVTGLEEEECMENWWDRNKSVLEKQMSFDGHACITATKGKRRNNQYVFAREYEESRERVTKLIEQHCSGDVLKAEKPRRLGVIGIVKIMINVSTKIFKIPPLVLRDELYKVLKEGGYADKDAREIANEAEIGAIRMAGAGGYSVTVT